MPGKSMYDGGNSSFMWGCGRGHWAWTLTRVRTPVPFQAVDAVVILRKPSWYSCNPDPCWQKSL